MARARNDARKSALVREGTHWDPTATQALAGRDPTYGIPTGSLGQEQLLGLAHLHGGGIKMPPQGYLPKA